MRTVGRKDDPEQAAARGHELPTAYTATLGEGEWRHARNSSKVGRDWPDMPLLQHFKSRLLLRTFSKAHFKS